MSLNVFLMPCFFIYEMENVKKIVLELLGGLNEVIHMKGLAHSKYTISVGQYCFSIFIILKQYKHMTNAQVVKKRRKNEPPPPTRKP